MVKFIEEFMNTKVKSGLLLIIAFAVFNPLG